MWHWRLKVADKRLKKKPQLMFKLFYKQCVSFFVPEEQKNQNEVTFQAQNVLSV